ncbi:MAG: hypothetical protein HYZ42_05790 [Bacteroidetes bacterium]|nr:hypothetical protein [Bacteroidota bacterium]
MKISNKIEPTAGLKEFWKLVLKRKNVELGLHKAPGMYGEVSAIIVVLYILTIAAVGGDIYLAMKILMKAGVKPAFVFIQIGADIVLAILPFILLTIGFKVFDKVANKNLKLFYELDSKLERNDHTPEQNKNRKESNKNVQLPPIKNRILWGKILTFIINAAIFGVAYWKIHTYANTIPVNISNTANGKMVITLAILVALFHVIATERTLIHILYWFSKNRTINKHTRVNNVDFEPKINQVEIKYKGNYVNAISGYTRIEKSGEIVILYYANVITDEEIIDLLIPNADNNAKMGIIASCKEIQLNH